MKVNEFCFEVQERCNELDEFIASGWIIFLIYGVFFSILFLCVWILYKYKSFKAWAFLNESIVQTIIKPSLILGYES